MLSKTCEHAFMFSKTNVRALLVGKLCLIMLNSLPIYFDFDKKVQLKCRVYELEIGPPAKFTF